MPFTEKVYPHVAMRETHLKEAPMPKVKKTTGEKAGDDIEQKNPLWLKDKGDEFVKNKDFYSAINAYTQAHKLDNNFIQCIANRTVCNMHLFNYEEVLNDVEKILSYLQSKKEDELKEEKN